MREPLRRAVLPLAAAFLFALAGCSGPQPTSGSSAPVSPQHRAAPRSSSTAAATGSFDFYLLNLSWSPEYCHSHPGAAECAAHATFVLHGLWPENADGTYPQHCSNAPGPADPSQYADLYPEAGLLQHEWQTHGTCSGLGPDAYFALERSARAKVRVPAAFSELTKAATFSPSQIVSLFTASNAQLPASSVAVSCGNNYLTAVEACFDTKLQPVACGAVRQCRANLVRVAPPQF